MLASKISQMVDQVTMAPDIPVESFNGQQLDNISQRWQINQLLAFWAEGSWAAC